MWLNSNSVLVSERLNIIMVKLCIDAIERKHDKYIQEHTRQKLSFSRVTLFLLRADNFKLYANPISRSRAYHTIAGPAHCS